MTECQIRLHRDALNTPWGFRLQGGKDFKAPLSVQRVFVGSPADGELHRGDVLVAIDNYDTIHLTHKQAQDIIKNAGGSLSFRIKRGLGYSAPTQPQSPVRPITSAAAAGYRSRPLDTIAPKPAPPLGAFSPKSAPAMQQSYGIDYGRQGAPAAGNMLSKVNASLQHSMWTPDDSQDPEYEYKPAREIKQLFDQGQPRQQPAYSQGYQPARRQPWRKPQADGSGLREPGWAPQPKGAYAPVRAPAPPAPVPVNRQPPQNRAPPQHLPSERPAWQGSLRGSGGPRPWEIVAGESLVPGGIDAHVPTGPSSMPHQAPQANAYNPRASPNVQQQPRASPNTQLRASPNVQPHSPRVQNTHYGPGGGPQYQQLSPGRADPDTAKIVHSQYNSPLGLYSKENVQAALDGQTTGKPGEGTMSVTGPDGRKKFNPAQSDVYRLLQEEQEVERHRYEQMHQPDQSARYQEHQAGQEMQYHGYQDHTKKSPSMMALEAHVLDEGTSDF